MFKKTSIYGITLRAALFLSLCSTLMIPAEAGPKTGTNLTGTVLDRETKKPLAGAYVLAVYKSSKSSMYGHAASWCTKTRGLFTNATGGFSFPFEANSSIQIFVAKEDFAEDIYARYIWGKSASGRATRVRLSAHFLVALDRDKIVRPDVVMCERPESAVDVAANLVYLRILEKNEQKFRLRGRSYQGLIDHLEDLPK